MAAFRGGVQGARRHPPVDLSGAEYRRGGDGDGGAVVGGRHAGEGGAHELDGCQGVAGEHAVGFGGIDVCELGAAAGPGIADQQPDVPGGEAVGPSGQVGA
ncbi:hypothetical protein SSP24_50450 [Streptomyces spinoverrucosus]|uniref:Uncharacterized protein n=1 Tax=Streptomyces spinoverrucosus TaxID=284043 RepID=A0A4Y3VNY0_9ACTN|nr:hypothetical protein SSP24_50450 [Streptomyces spinoverrucosus]GHB54923.1 hypothetical protein GCM10010397_26600 [Streptomyces spinoverrucosus]